MSEMTRRAFFARPVTARPLTQAQSSIAPLPTTADVEAKLARYNASYLDWCTTRACGAHNDIAANGVTASALNRFGVAMRSFANHIEDCGADAAVMAMAYSVDPNVLEQLLLEPSTPGLLAAAANRYGANTTATAMGRLLAPLSGSMAKGLDECKRGGISRLVHTAADTAFTTSKNTFGPAQMLAPATLRSGLTARTVAEVDMVGHSALRPVGFGSVCHKLMCYMLDSSPIYNTITGAIATALMQFAPEIATGTCVAADLAPWIAAPLTDGGSLLAEPLAISFCGYAVTFAGYLNANAWSGVAVGTVVGTFADNMKEWAGC